MTAPSRPWENGNFNRMPLVNEFVGSQMGYGGATAAPPPLPPRRPANYGSYGLGGGPMSMYSSGMYGSGSYMNPFSGSGMFGGSPYGNFSSFPYNRNMVDPRYEDEGSPFQGIESVVRAISSLSMMLESTYQEPVMMLKMGKQHNLFFSFLSHFLIPGVVRLLTLWLHVALKMPEWVKVLGQPVKNRRMSGLVFLPLTTSMYMSLRAVLGVAENMERLRSVFVELFGSLAVFRTFIWFAKKILYILGLIKDNPVRESVWQAVAAEVSGVSDGQQPPARGRRAWPIVAFFGLMCGGPYLLSRLMTPSDLSPKNWDPKTDGVKCVAMYDFETNQRGELPFRRGEVITRQKAVRGGWVLAANRNGKIGHVPADRLKPGGEKPGGSFSDCLFSGRVLSTVRASSGLRGSIGCTSESTRPENKQLENEPPGLSPPHNPRSKNATSRRRITDVIAHSKLAPPSRFEPVRNPHYPTISQVQPATTNPASYIRDDVLVRSDNVNISVDDTSNLEPIEIQNVPSNGNTKGAEADSKK